MSKNMMMIVLIFRRNPSPFRMMCYRYSVCFACTLASLLYMLGVHSLVKHEVADGVDAAVIIVIIVALYFENQVSVKLVP